MTMNDVSMMYVSIKKFKILRGKHRGFLTTQINHQIWQEGLPILLNNYELTVKCIFNAVKLYLYKQCIISEIIEIISRFFSFFSN